MRCRPSFYPLALALLTAWIFSSPAAWSAETREVEAWYDTLGFPDAKDLPYVRVATGSWRRSGNQPPENTFVEGFLVREEAAAFTVFICSVSDFKDRFELPGGYAPLTIVRFVPKTTGPAHERVGYEVQDFTKVAEAVLKRVRSQATNPEGGLQRGRPVAHQARIFSFARACQQKGLTETASALMALAANIPDEETGKVDPQMLRENLQRQIGEAVLEKAETDCGYAAVPWAELLKAYEHFDTQFPASPRVAYAQEAAGLLRRMIAEEAAHHPKPLEEMSPAEQVAENIYQLRNMGYVVWVIDSHYPIDASTADGKEMITPVHRLVDLGHAAIPQLIEALDDRRFTRSIVQSFHLQIPPTVMRVGDVALEILQFISGRNTFARKTDDGKLIEGTTRQQAEAWWAEVQSKGEKAVLITAVAAGDQEGCAAARRLVAKYPDAAIDAIKAGIHASTEEGYRGEFVEVAGALPGDMPVAFLKSKLAPGNGLYSQVYAAKALFARGQPEALPAMIHAWRKIQPRLPANVTDAYDEVGYLITFLAKSGDLKAIESLAVEARKAPVDVRLAVVEVFMPWGKNGVSSGQGVHVDSDIEELPAGEAGAAIERLLVSALEDRGKRMEMKGTFNEVSYEDPRICDMAALALSLRWPEKYQFDWAADPKQCDAQIGRMLDRWRSESSLRQGLENIVPKK